ncbi:GMC oxidoreductase [Beijerinckia sp. L45]|uniref:GMC oxidoreductase n=1 Tax=Beijerinckia sp. L45 TaxID=1641855 RepID=UPI00131C50F7|nr:GMC family oxidoreductase [Beijerinckia sp. L45]
MSSDHYDVIVIGSGPGGGALASRLAPTGKRILMLERGDFLKREPDNWDSKAVFVDGKYQARETWYDKKGKAFHPGLHYYVGGNSKVYGSALIRLRREDFGEMRHVDGVSPAWPLGYDAFDQYYLEAEKLFHVHGQRGEDPNEPNAVDAFPYPPVQHERVIQTLNDCWTKQGLKPFHLPLGILLDQQANGQPTPTSACIRCDAFDGFPCITNGKADSEIVCINPTLKLHDNFTLLTNAYVTKLETDASGKTVTGVCVTRNGENERYSADIVVSACGALSSALLLLRSANGAHPNGLANGSDQVGRNYMRHNQSVLMAVSRNRNDTIFQKTLAISDYYLGADDWKYPLGFIQMCGKSHGEQIRGEALPQWLGFLPNMPFDQMAAHAIDFWLSSEDLPHPDNRITLSRDGKVNLAVTLNNMEAHARLRKKLEGMVNALDVHPYFMERSLYLGKTIPVGGTAHQAGTLRFGTDPKTSVLDTDCKAHELDNLYVTDASFFPTIGAVNPTLTIIANALRVADHLKTRLAA